MKKSRKSREEKAALELKLARIRVLSDSSLTTVIGGLKTCEESSCDISACNTGSCDCSK